MRTLDLVLDRAIAAVSAVVMVVAAVALTLMMVHVAADVVGKYFLNSPVPLTLEMVSTYYMVAVVFLPLAAVERQDGHIHVELIATMLPRVGQRLLDVMAYLLSFAFFAVMTRYAFRSAMRKFQIGEFIMGTYPIIVWPTRFIVPAGTALISLLLLLKLVRAAVRLVRADLDTPKSSKPEATSH